MTLYDVPGYGHIMPFDGNINALSVNMIMPIDSGPSGSVNFVFQIFTATAPNSTTLSNVFTNCDTNLSLTGTQTQNILALKVPISPIAVSTGDTIIFVVTFNQSTQLTENLHVNINASISISA